MAVQGEHEALLKDIGKPDIYPADGWIATYIDYARPQTDAPDIYHLATGLALLASWLGNRVWIEAYGGKMFPSIWTVMLGSSSIMRKSTAIRIGLSVLTRAEIPMEGHAGILIPKAGSKEGIENHLARRADGLIVAWEFGELLKQLGRDFMGGVKEEMTHWYDGDTSSRVMVGGTVTVKDPAITILGASTYEWLEEAAKENDLKGGFLARFLFWPAGHDDKNGWMSLGSPADVYTRTRLVDILTSIRGQYTGLMTFEPDASKVFDEWLYRHETSFDTKEFPRQLTAFHGRLPANIIKMAMIFEAASLRGPKAISAKSVSEAIKVAEWLKDGLIKVFAEELTGQRHSSQDLKRFTDQLNLKTWTPRREVMRKLKWSRFEIDRVVETLLESETIESERKEESNGKSSVHYRRRKLT